MTRNVSITSFNASNRSRRSPMMWTRRMTPQVISSRRLVETLDRLTSRSRLISSASRASGETNRSAWTCAIVRLIPRPGPSRPSGGRIFALRASVTSVIPRRPVLSVATEIISRRGVGSNAMNIPRTDRGRVKFSAEGEAGPCGHSLNDLGLRPPMTVVEATIGPTRPGRGQPTMRRATLATTLLCGSIAASGCTRSSVPPSAAPPVTPPVARVAEPKAAPAAPAPPQARITPAAATLFAGDPGLQLIADLPGGRGGRRDVSSTVGLAGRARGDRQRRRGGLRPAASPRDGPAHDRGRGVLRRDYRGRRLPKGLVIRPGYRADPDPRGMQHGRMPRPGRRAERLPPLALRIRPRGRPQEPDPRPRRTPVVFCASRVEPLPGQGDRHDPARRGAEDPAGLGRIPDAPGLAQGRRALRDHEESRQIGQDHGRAGRRPARRAGASATPRGGPLLRRPPTRRDPVGDLQDQRRLGR